MSLYHTYSDCIRVFYFAPVASVNAIQVNVDESGFDQTQYSWSYSLDDSTWSELYTSEAAIIAAILAENFQDVNLYLKVQIDINKAEKTQSFSSYTLESVFFDGVEANVTNIEIQNNNNILVTSNTKNIFNPYRSSAQQKQLYDKLSRSISDIFAFECIYFRTEPVKNTADVTFRSYKLSQVVEHKQLRVVINRNELPDKRLLFEELNLDFQDELEIHIVKSVFTEIFGENLQPEANDFLYLPLTDRMYEISTAGDGAQFMNHAPYWKAYLVKYEQRSSIEATGDEFLAIEDLVDNEVDFESETFEAEKDSATKEFNEIKQDERDYAISDEQVVVDNYEVVRWMYDYTSRLNVEVAKSYDVVATSSEWSVAAWVRVTPNTARLFSIVDENQQPIYGVEFMGDHFQVFVDDMINRITADTVDTIPGTNAIAEDTVYGIVANYSNSVDFKMMTLSIFDTNLNLVHEVAESNIPDIVQSTAAVQFMGSQKIGNIRIGKGFIAKDDMIPVLGETLPDTFDYYVLDNATPNYEQQ